MSEMIAERKWYAIYTKPRWEKKIFQILQKKGVDVWCPLHKQVKQWKDRKKSIEEPIFKSYLFVHINYTDDRINILQVDGVLRFVYYLGKPAVIRDEEIKLIKKYLNEDDAIERVEIISQEQFNTDAKVKVVHGVFMDNEGVVISSNKKRVFVQIHSLGQVMVVQFPVNHLVLN